MYKILFSPRKSFLSRSTVYFWLRNALIGGQILVWMLSETVWDVIYPSWILYLCIGYFFINLMYKKQFPRPSDKQMFWSLLLDVVELSIFFYLSGGASNPFTWFLLLPIIFSASVLRGSYTWILTAVAILAYSLLIQFYLPSAESHHHHGSSFNQHIVGMWMGFIVIAILVALVIGGLLNNIRNQESLLHQAKMKKIQSDKILALATLASGSAHELGTPLATINFITDELLVQSTSTQHRDLLEQLKKQVYRCKDSLTNITASTGLTQAIQGQKLSLPDFYHEIKGELESPKIEIFHSLLDNSEQMIITDKTLNQSLLNVISNAVESDATCVKVVFRILNQRLIIDVEDDGSGFEYELGQLKDSNKDFGMGLGLFLAHATIERFDGSIKKIKSNHSGSHIQISLPTYSS